MNKVEIYRVLGRGHNKNALTYTTHMSFLSQEISWTWRSFGKSPGLTRVLENFLNLGMEEFQKFSWTYKSPGKSPGLGRVLENLLHLKVENLLDLDESQKIFCTKRSPRNFLYIEESQKIYWTYNESQNYS